MLINSVMDWGAGDWETGLGGASHMGRHDIVQFLLEKGARLDVTNAVGWTPLMIAEGLYIGQTEKEQPAVASLIRQLLKRD